MGTDEKEDLKDIDYILCTHNYIDDVHHIGSSVYTAPFVQICEHCGHFRPHPTFAEEALRKQQMLAARHEYLKEKQRYDEMVKRIEMQAKYGIK